MASNNNYSNNSLQPRLPFLCTPEQYAENQLWIQQQAGRFSEVNRRGMEAYMRLGSELQRKIAEGDQARQQMQLLQQMASTRAITGPVGNGGGQYPIPGYVVNQQPAVSSTNFINPTDTFRTNMQDTYTANAAPANASPNMVQIASSSREQIGQRSGNGAQQDPINVPQRKATPVLLSAPALPPEPNGDLLRAQAQLAARLKAQAYTIQGTFPNVQIPITRQGSTNGAAVNRHVNTWEPTMQATPQHQLHGNVPPPNALQPVPLSNSLRQTSSPTSNPTVSGAAAPSLLAASLNSFRSEISKSAPSTTVQTYAPNVTFTAAGENLTPGYAQKQAASLETAVADASQHCASSAPIMYKPYSTAGLFSSTTDNPLPPMQNLHGVPILTGPYRTTQFTTPPPDVSRPPAPMTPASANKKTLAKDILRALGDPSKKRKASTPPSTVSDDDMQPAMKKQAVAPLPVMSDLFATSSTLLATEVDGVARIEEVVDETVSENGPTVAASTLAARDTAAGAHEELPPVSDPVLASDTPSVPDSLPLQSAGESRASSEPVLHVDTALQPLEDSSIPLFLPSPDSPRETPLSSVRREETRKRRTNEIASTSFGLQSRQGRKRSTQVFVEVPTLSAAQRQRFLKQDTTDKEATEPKYSPSVLSPQERFKGRASAVENVVDENCLRLAQEASDVAASRLRKRPCSWNDCFYIANNANSLKAHVWDHVDSIPSKEKLFPCWWGECIRRFNKKEALAQHLQNHVKKSIFCAYQGCEEQFVHPLELLTHVESKHPSGSKLRPSVTPFVPPRQTSPPLRTMFAYHDVHLPVQMSRMTIERRAKLGPWVAKNCFGAVSLGTPKLIARNQSQRRRAGDVEAKVPTTWEDKYDFAEPWNATYPAHCADLESSKATEDIEGGLLLAPDVAGPQGPLEEQLLTSRVERIKLGGTQEYVIDVERNSEEPEPEPSEIKLEDTYTDLSQGPPSNTSQESRGVGHQDFLGVGEPQLVEPGSA